MNWYEEDVKQVEKSREKIMYEPKTIFYGSSSIRMWDTLYDDFKPFLPLNLGFGGSTMAACVWFFERIVTPVKKPERIIIYAGDNDLGDERFPEEVFIFYQQLICKIKKYYDGVECAFISIKPSPSRMNIFDNIQRTNQLIRLDIENSDNGMYYIDIFEKMMDPHGKPKKDLFSGDGLHLSKSGYQVWKNTLLNHKLFSTNEKKQ